MLGFQTETSTMHIWFPGLSLQAPIQKVTAVKLDSWLSRCDLHDSSSAWFVHHRCQRQPIAFTIKNKVVIKTKSELQLFIFLPMSRPIAFACVKSKGVPATALISPVGISVESTGV